MILTRKLRFCLPAFVLLAGHGVPALEAADKSIGLNEYDLGGFTSGWGKPGKNKSAIGKDFSIAGEPFKEGVGVHAPSIGFFSIPEGESLSFMAKVGVDDGPDHAGSVKFLVIADGKTLFDSGVMKKGDKAREINVDLTGYKGVRLSVTDAGDGIDSDHGDWVDAKFIYSDEAPALSLPWAAGSPNFSEDSTKLSLPKPARVISSPDNRIKAGVGVSDGRLVIKVLRDGKISLDTSPLGVTVDGVDLGKDVTIGKSEPYTTDVSYPLVGHPEQLHDFSKGEKIQITPKGGKPWTLDVRCYADGVAWRYLIPGGGSRTISGEATAFVLPEGSSYWTHNNTIAYEANYTRFETGSSRLPARPITMPVTVELPDGGFACITEDTMIENDYSGMTLGPRGRILNGIFEDDQTWKLTGEITTPWRVVIMAKDLTSLINQTIVYNLAPPPDKKLFPEGPDAGWIQPGNAFWTWIYGLYGSAKWEGIMGYIDEAAFLKCEYYVIDDAWRDPRSGWHRNGKDEWASLKEAADYAKTKGVKLMVWEHWQKIRDKGAREEFFENLSKAGGVGAKIDFMESESQERLEFFKDCLTVAAKHKILINFHGANKPAGEERTWPNWLTREAIYGMEQRGNVTRTQFAALPFTRFVTGPADFTPTTFDSDTMGNTTAGSQLATAIAYSSPLNHWAGSTASYRAQPEEVLEFIRTKPVVWDETLVLPGSKIGEIAAIARRSGETWWICAINGTDDKMDYGFDLDFIGSGQWEGTSFEDGDEKTKLKITHPKIRSGQAIKTAMSPGGGYVLILKPA